MTITEYLRKKIREELNNVADNLAADGAKSFDEYRFNTGMVAGLAIAERYVLDLEESLKDSNDPEEDSQ